MRKRDISGIAPRFIARNNPAALAFYRDRLGFDITRDGLRRFELQDADGYVLFFGRQNS